LINDRVFRVVAQRVDLAVLVAYQEIWIHRGDFFTNQP
jgi:hypothetical protein